MLLQAIFMTVLLLASPRAWGGDEKFTAEHPSKVASTWFELLYQVVKVEKTPPPAASRAYGVAAGIQAYHLPGYRFLTL
jgi:hypothetical protein